MVYKNQIETDEGLVEAFSPMIISASRATDLPAYYPQYILNCFKQGYTSRINPFNGKKFYISLDNCKFIVFWSKNPQPLFSSLNFFNHRNIDYYFQFTLNDYEKEGFEPNIPDLKKRIDTFKSLSKQIGKEKVIWRFDPLILTTSTGELVKKIESIYNQIYNYTDTLIISFGDIEKYRKVKKRFKDSCISYKEWNEDNIEKFCNKLTKAIDTSQINIQTCSENYNLENFKITTAGCISQKHIQSISNDSQLLYYLNNSKSLKDRGQRKFCNCIESKDIGFYNSCPSLCIYCYANSQNHKVLETYKSLKNKLKHTKNI